MALLSTFLHVLEIVETGGAYLARFSAAEAALLIGLLYLLGLTMGYPNAVAVLIVASGIIAFYDEKS